MANISWTSSSINSYFKTSLGNKSSVFDSVYSSLSDSALIKSGSYGKLMKSYYATLKKEESTSTDKAKTSSSALDELLKKDSTYNSDGTKNASSGATTVDTQI